MEASQRFNWEWLGKPDYSQAAAFVASLPKEVKLGLNQTAERTCVKLFFLIWNGAAHSGRGNGYAIPSQGYLGNSIERSRYSISRALRVLSELGLVERRRRAPVLGKYQTCLYLPGKRLLAALYARFSKLMFGKNRVAKTPHNDLKKGIVGTHASDPTTIPPQKLNTQPADPDLPLDAESGRRLFAELKQAIAKKLPA